jgi:hypothetical protein
VAGPSVEEGHAFVEAEQLLSGLLAVGFLLHDDRHVLQGILKRLGESVQGGPDDLLKIRLFHG